eukprot:TRINITY_DN26162_c0_g2_i1.p1 TRINITY_DN26162_c0_g2~~TRINITY_DN26162_c0_g2_i1.p1  ORF type:complete len:321 (-),score=54.91 TRINITY_DN26162_c0_g2_i1:123-1028(-)
MGAECFFNELNAGDQFPNVPPNPGPMPLDSHFTLVLEKALDRLNSGDDAIKRYVVHACEEFATFFDGYPKASTHLLVLPRRVRIAGLASLKPEHLSMLRRLAAYVAWVMSSLSSQMAGAEAGWTHGFHSVPSLRQLHVHVLTRDFQPSSIIKHKAIHFNSFRSPFLVSLDDVIEALESGMDLSNRFRLTTAKEEMYKRSLQCHRCGADFDRRFADLKRHLSSCREAPTDPPAEPPSRWRRERAAGAIVVDDADASAGDAAEEAPRTPQGAAGQPQDIDRGGASGKKRLRDADDDVAVVDLT